ncbi:MAG: hypothetical protein ABNH02_03110 [Pseudomonadales bacterium]
MVVIGFAAGWLIIGSESTVIETPADSGWALELASDETGHDVAAPLEAATVPSVAAGSIDPIAADNSTTRGNSDPFETAIIIDDQSGELASLNSQKIEELMMDYRFTERIHNAFPVTENGFELQSKFSGGLAEFDSELIGEKSIGCTDKYCLAEFSLSDENQEGALTGELMKSLSDTPAGGVVYGIYFDELTSEYKYRLAYYPNVVMN